MAASDKYYRSQHGLDIVFSVSSLLMLLSLVWMFAQDYYREFKTEQRAFRDVESALAATLALQEVPGEEFLEAREKVIEAKKKRKSENKEIEDLRVEVKKRLPTKEKADNKYNDVKAELESAISFRDIAIDEHNGNTSALDVKMYQKKIDDYEAQLVKAKAEKDAVYAEIREYQSQIDTFEDGLTRKIGELKKVTDKFDTQVALAIGKQWGWGDAIRAMPILDAFASPIKIKQHVIKDVTLDYNFVQAVRFDRCTTCHQGVEKAPFTRENLDHIVSHFDPIQEASINELLDYIRGMTNIPVAYEYPSPYRRYALRLKGARAVFDGLVEAEKNNTPVSNEALAKRAADVEVPLSGGPRGQVEQLRVRYVELVALLDPDKADQIKTGERLTKIVDLEYRLADAQFVLDLRGRTLKGTPEGKNLPAPGELKITRLAKDVLTNARVTEFCAHPRMDLYVAPNSKHPVEKFGCTSCHGGQPSGTSFVYASHTPKDTPTKKQWEKKFDWFDVHDWDFPMTPKRFVESGCLKCHHQVTDLITTENRNEAPKLLRGFNLIKENGCFGCHEIAGRKGGRDIGPDLRLEAYPPLEDLPPGERTKIESDPDTRPGKLRKVGPSLFRISEKTTELWTSKWINSPRGFRPDTKMPHFYGLSNNRPDMLPDDQKPFPKAEIQAISYYLFKMSKQFVNEVDTLAKLSTKEKLNEKESKQLTELEKKIRPNLRHPLKPLDELIGDKDFKADPKRGRTLFIERGCLACHVHQATQTKQFGLPAITGEAEFGPNLSQVAEKFKGMKEGEARRWLVSWILDPHVHSPRSRMPQTHLEPKQAADLAEWLLTEKATDLGKEWTEPSDEDLAEPADLDTLKNLARVYFVRLMAASDMEKMLEGNLPVDDPAVTSLPQDEIELAKNFNPENLKFYLGKKAVGRLGCYACHDVPGYDNAKPIGVGLNDWGKKNHERLAFEDIHIYIQKYHYEVETPVNPKTKEIYGLDDKGRSPIESFYWHNLEPHHGTRTGYLFQKLNEPRSYDFNRIRAWDDRSRMPQFRFSRLKQKADEDDKAFEARRILMEQEAREAVMTFILGLTAEQVPTQSINQPKGDRLAEVKGRQVLDTFNCAGCHQIRGGYVEYQLKPGNLEIPEPDKTDHYFPNDYNWRDPHNTGNKLIAQGFFQRDLLREADPDAADDPDDSAKKLAMFKLVHAARFNNPDKKGEEVNIPAESKSLQLKRSDIVSPAVARLPFDDPRFQDFLIKERGGLFGGSFSDLLAIYLYRLNKEDYKMAGGDSSRARVEGPPPLMGQGGRTQPEWLYKFLLDPFPVRKMSRLRMPKFNLSREDARALVDYFGGVERMTNINAGTSYPFETIEQKSADAPVFWHAKNTEYVARMKSVKSKTDPKKSVYDLRLEELEPLWGRIAKDAAKQKQDAEAQYKVALQKFEKQKAEVEKIKDKPGPDLVAAQGQLDADSRTKDAWEREVEGLTKQVKDLSPESQKKSWLESDAYLNDAFRLVVNQKLCLQCHAIGYLGPKEGTGQTMGPPLDKVHGRLRPTWTEHWVANPQRFLTYTSSMPNNFVNDVKVLTPEDPWLDLFPGTQRDRIAAVRDLLMVYPEAAKMPLNRFITLPPQDAKMEEKKAEEKKPEEKKPEEKKKEDKEEKKKEDKK